MKVFSRSVARILQLRGDEPLDDGIATSVVCPPLSLGELCNQAIIKLRDSAIQAMVKHLSQITLTWIWLRKTAARRTSNRVLLLNSSPKFSDFSKVQLRWSASFAKRICSIHWNKFLFKSNSWKKRNDVVNLVLCCENRFAPGFARRESIASVRLQALTHSYWTPPPYASYLPTCKDYNNKYLSRKYAHCCRLQKKLFFT